MFSISGSTTNGLSSAETSFANAARKATDKGRVQSQALKRLLKEVRNAPSDISFEQFEGINKSRKSLCDILKGQNSIKFYSKTGKLNTALELVEGKLSGTAREKIKLVKEQQAVDIKEQCVCVEKNLKKAYSKGVRNLERSESTLKTAQGKVELAVDALPENLKKLALHYISTGQYYRFDKDSNTLPSHVTERKVKGKWGMKTDYLSTPHPYAKSWLAVGQALGECEKIKDRMNSLKDLLSDRKDMLKLRVDASGAPELTKDQISLLKAHPAK